MTHTESLFDLRVNLILLGLARRASPRLLYWIDVTLLVITLGAAIYAGYRLRSIRLTSDE